LIINAVVNWFQASVDEANSLRSLVTKKEAEIEKYKKYLEKAKTVSPAVFYVALMKFVKEQNLISSYEMHLMLLEMSVFRQ